MITERDRVIVAVNGGVCARRFKGLVSYSLVRTARGGFSITLAGLMIKRGVARYNWTTGKWEWGEPICQDKAGTDESIRAARDWIAKNDARAAVPTVSEGAVIPHF